jgi:arginyl-tRNA synthetase
MQDKLKNWISDILKIEGEVILTHPKDFKNGDYTFISPIETAPENFEKLNQNKLGIVEKIEIVGRFINIYLSPSFFHGSVEEILNNKNFGENKSLQNKKIMVEYTDPNPFKPFHIGHLMTNAIGESLARILESSGATVSRANYQGDVGLHVAKAIWGLMKDIKLQETKDSIMIQAHNIGVAYVDGSAAYEADENSKKEIDEINQKIYSRESEKINAIYDWGFKTTMAAFEDLYKMLGTKFDFYFLESEMAPIGQAIVKENMGKIFEESEGATVFKADNHDPKLHTRVFITKTGLPTYETKELGLIQEKFKVLPNMNLCIVTTANEQLEYMRVVTKALSLLHPEFTDKMKHITHGMMRLASGKMSSRKGNVITGESLIRDTIALVSEKVKDREWDEDKKDKISEQVGVAAIKYSILKQSTGGDIAYDFETSISFEGDSGPYLQYSYARANSVLEKAAQENILPDPHSKLTEIFDLEKLLYRFPEVVARSAEEYEPHYIANYLIEVARSFNSFYGNNMIVNKEDKNSGYKVALTFAFAFVMKKGLNLLGIEAPEKM